MAKRVKFFIALMLCGCPAISFAITPQEYGEVTLGTSVSEMVSLLGEPYTINCLEDKAEEYEYIERFAMNNELVYETHYLFKVVNGQVVSKRTYREQRPAYDQIWQVDPNYPTYP